jgi:hypothetical protein
MPSPRRKLLVRACIEIAFIVFLFYSNLLMGEFTVRNEAGKSWKSAVTDIMTEKNLAIAIVSSVVGFACIEALRKRL